MSGPGHHVTVDEQLRSVVREHHLQEASQKEDAGTTPAPAATAQGSTKKRKQIEYLPGHYSSE